MPDSTPRRFKHSHLICTLVTILASTSGCVHVSMTPTPTIQPRPSEPTSTPTSMVFATPTDPLSTDVPALLPDLQPITIENAENLQLIRVLQIPGYEKTQKSQCSVAFNQDGSYLVGACGKSQVPVWDVASGQILYTLYDPPQHIVACDFSPVEDMVACGGFDESITIWNTVNGEQISRLDGHTAPIWDIAFHPLEKALASCSLGQAKSRSSTSEVLFWDLNGEQPAWEYSVNRAFLSLSFHPSGEYLAYGALGGSVGIMDAKSAELIIELSDSHRNIGDMAYSPSGQWLAAGSDDDSIYLWDTSSFQLAAQLAGHNDYVNGVAFKKDGLILVSGSHDNSLGIWNLEANKPISFLSGHKDAVLRVAINPQGNLIASISWDGTVRLWGVIDG